MYTQIVFVVTQYFINMGIKLKLSHVVTQYLINMGIKLKLSHMGCLVFQWRFFVYRR